MRSRREIFDALDQGPGTAVELCERAGIVPTASAIVTLRKQLDSLAADGYVIRETGRGAHNHRAYRYRRADLEWVPSSSEIIRDALLDVIGGRPMTLTDGETSLTVEDGRIVIEGRTLGAEPSNGLISMVTADGSEIVVRIPWAWGVRP